MTSSSYPPKSFSEWLLSEPIGIATFSCAFACTAEGAITSIRNLIVKKSLEDQSKLNFNHFTGNVEYNTNVNHNRANRDLLMNQTNCVNKDQSPSLQSQLACRNLEFFDYIDLPHIGYTLLAIALHIALGLFMIWLVYLVLLKLKMVAPRTAQQQKLDEKEEEEQEDKIKF